MTTTATPTPPAPAGTPGPPGPWRWIILGVLIVGACAVVPLVSPYLPATPEEDEVGPLAHPVRPKDSGPPGRVVVEGAMTHDFGRMPQFDTGSKTWVVRNEGQGDVIMRLGPKDCSCTVANLPDRQSQAVLKAGTSTEITLSWETRDNHDAFEKGAIIYLDNDADRQELKFMIKGDVQPAIVTVPPEPILDFASVANDEPHTAFYAISSPDRPDMKVTAVRSSDPERVTATFEPLDEEAKKHLVFKTGYKITVTVKPSTTLGVFSQVLTVETDHPRKKEFKIEVGGRLVGPVTISPSTIRLAGVPGRQGASTWAMILVRGQDRTEFQIEKTPEGLKAAIEPVDDKAQAAGKAVKLRQYRITVTVPPGTPPNVIEGSIVLKADHPSVREVSIPVHITIQGAG